MRIISRKRLKDFWEHHSAARQPLQAWYADVKRATWRSPADIKRVYRNASFMTNKRVVFNIRGNGYRLVAAIQYAFGIAYIRFVGTHEGCDRIDDNSI